MGKKKKKGFLSRLKKNPQALLQIGAGLADVYGAAKGKFNEYDKDGNRILDKDGKPRKNKTAVDRLNEMFSSRRS